jgi:hypothetical protein
VSLCFSLYISILCVSLQGVLRSEFKRNAAEADEAIVEKLKSNAVRGLSNYLMMESSSKDERFQKRATAFVKREVDSLKDGSAFNT